jgi:hypothetical protein
MILSIKLVVYRREGKRKQQMEWPKGKGGNKSAMRWAVKWMGRSIVMG